MPTYIKQGMVHVSCLLVCILKVQQFLPETGIIGVGVDLDYILERLCSVLATYT